MESALFDPWALLAEPVYWVGASTALLFGGVAVGHWLAGPTRWVKLATLALLASFAGLWSLYQGPQSAALVMLGIVGIAFAAPMLALISWRHPLQKTFLPVGQADFPAWAHKRLERWSEELAAAGYQPHSDRVTTWRVQGQERATFVRFLAHHGDPIWFEIHVLSSPRVMARAIVSAKGEGRVIMTCDQQADQEVLRDDVIRIQRAPRQASCLDLLDRHRQMALSSEGSFEPVGDPVAAHTHIYDAWVRRLIDRGIATEAEPGWIRIPPHRLPGVVARTHAAWLH
jgi:hypothetical protein